MGVAEYITKKGFEMAFVSVKELFVSRAASISKLPAVLFKRLVVWGDD